MTTKKKYEKPAMQVYDLPQQPQLLAGSNNGGGGIPGNPNYPGGNPDPFSY
jgi:hypothetical protein